MSFLTAAYDYRAFGEEVDLTLPADKVTENFTGKERDDETNLGYWGARYLDQMLGMWVSVDKKRQFSSPYLYAGNGANPVNVVDPDGNEIQDYSLSFRASVILGIYLKIGFVINTEDIHDCGIIHGAGIGTGIELSAPIESNTVKTVLAGTNSFLGSETKASTAHDLEGSGLTMGFGLLLGANFDQSGFKNLELGQIGGGAYYTSTGVTTFSDVFGDNSRILLPTAGPAPSDNTNVAVPKMDDDL